MSKFSISNLRKYYRQLWLSYKQFVKILLMHLFNSSKFPLLNFYTVPHYSFITIIIAISVQVIADYIIAIKYCITVQSVKEEIQSQIASYCSFINHKGSNKLENDCKSYSYLNQISIPSTNDSWKSFPVSAGDFNFPVIQMVVN